MRLTDCFLRLGSLKAKWLALVASCLLCALTVLFYQGLLVTWDLSVSHYHQGQPSPSDPPEADGTKNATKNNPDNYVPNNKNSQGLDTPAVDRRCQALADPGNVVFVIKTGATEIYEKLPTQLLTTLGCVEDFLIFSDLEEQIGPYHIRDTLVDFNATLKETLSDFELYRLQQEYRRTGQDIASLKGDSKAAWTLDKYKFLHLVEKTWNERPNRDWYFFIESDTYVVWTNLILWLRQLSSSPSLSSAPSYLGAVAYVGGEPFAHGGSGFLISGSLLKRFVGQNPGIANQYDGAFSDQYYGDFVLAQTIKAVTNVSVTSYWPQVNGEKPSTLPFGPTHWCQPVVTMHHLHPRERSAIFDFEQARQDLTVPLTFRELSHITFPVHNFRVREDDWDNLSNTFLAFNTEHTISLETCQQACLRLGECFQWRYTHASPDTQSECYVSTKAFRLGSKRHPKDGVRWTSGWNTQYIQKWRDENPCETVAWVQP